MRYHGKRPPCGDHGCAPDPFWDGVFSKIDKKVPRVGKRGDDFDEIQRGVFGFKVRRVEACRGTERMRIPEQGTNRASIPLRITIVKDRSTGKAQVLGPAERWVSLTKGQQIRKGNLPK